MPMVVNTECIEMCQQCMLACEVCLAEMIGMESANDCPACCRECVDICSLCVLAMARRSHFASDYCTICADVCDWCAEQCGSHPHEHCKRCADACERCAASCRTMAG